MLVDCWRFFFWGNISQNHTKNGTVPLRSRSRAIFRGLFDVFARSFPLISQLLLSSATDQHVLCVSLLFGFWRGRARATTTMGFGVVFFEAGARRMSTLARCICAGSLEERVGGGGCVLVASLRLSACRLAGRNHLRALHSLFGVCFMAFLNSKIVLCSRLAIVTVPFPVNAKRGICRLTLPANRQNWGSCWLNGDR